MIFRRTLAVLVSIFAVLLVTLAVLMGFLVLVEGLGDQAASTALRWAGRVALVLLSVDLVLLVFALALHALSTPSDRA